MVGARPYPLSEAEANWLVTELGDREEDVQGARVAKAIRVALEDRSTEPLELGRSQVGPVCDTLLDSPFEGSPRIAALQTALRRYQGDAGA
jgi:hypothetical protein